MDSQLLDCWAWFIFWLFTFIHFWIQLKGGSCLLLEYTSRTSSHSIVSKALPMNFDSICSWMTNWGTTSAYYLSSKKVYAALLCLPLKAVLLQSSFWLSFSPIPHTLHEQSEVCLITKLPGKQVKEQLKVKGVTCITKVRLIPYSLASCLKKKCF